MEEREPKQYKALYFDLRVKALKQYFSHTNPRDAYRKIRDYFISHSFSHEQYSGYHSSYKTTDLEIFDLIRDMRKQFPWIRMCVNHFEVTNIGENHDLRNILTENMLSE